MDKISIVIVNYNVRYFLRQCIQSIQNSRTSAEFEIIVVDNNSTDTSLEMLRNEFPDVLLIANDTNVGFSKANNQGFKAATGNYVLILNPDTIIEENCIQTCLEYYKENKDIGAVGVRMVDGSGKYLPESKRGFPTPLSALFKIAGLSRLFSKSSFINSYYLGHLSENDVNEVDVLTGAFVFTDKKTLDSIRGFDEDYFMYGEDIEMSYQIKKLGKKVIYLPKTSIIHFKGESTQKSSLNYIKRFYGAMQIYAKKRHSNSSWIWNLILNIGIISVGLVGIIKNTLNKLLWPLINFVILFALSKCIQLSWATFYHKSPDYYINADSNLSLSILCISLVLCFYVMGHYDRKYTKKQWIYASSISALLLMALYGLFPLDWRFSRPVLVLLILMAPFVLYLLRCLFNKISLNNFSFDEISDRRILIVGSRESYDQVETVLRYYYKNLTYIGRVFETNADDSLGELLDLESIVEAKKINEIVFCSRDMLAEEIFNSIARLDKSIYFKIASNDNRSILGSSSKNSLGEWFTADIEFKLNQDFHKRTKRIIDVLFVFLVVILSVIVIPFSSNTKRIYSNLINVLLGNKTWISYNTEDSKIEFLPKIKDGVFDFKFFNADHSNQITHKVNLFYARNYNVWMEIDQLFKNIFTA